MNIDKASKVHLPQILQIIEFAKNDLRDRNIDQWQDTNTKDISPNKDTIVNDILNSTAYVVSDNSNIILAYASLSFQSEPTYQKVYDGNWSSDEVYGVIHRLAVGQGFRHRGVGAFLITELEKIAIKDNVNWIRIDTHKDNIYMQNLLKKLGYNFVGTIVLPSAAKRMAFEKHIIV